MAKNFNMVSICLISLHLMLFSCVNTNSVSTSEEMEVELKSIKEGEVKIVEVVGRLQEYDHKNGKGIGLWEMVVGERVMLLNASGGKDFELDKSHLNKTVSAQIEVTHYPLPGQLTQKGGLWISKVKNVKMLD